MKRSLLAAAVVAACFSLAACGISREEALAIDNDTCQSMGLKFGTPEFAQCRLMQDQRRDTSNAAARAAAAGAMQNYANQLMNQNQRTTVDVYHHRGF